MEELLKPQEQERPIRRTLCAILRRECNLKCLILTLLISGCIVAIVWCRVTRVPKIVLNFSAFPITSTKLVSPCSDGFFYTPVALVILLYGLYIVECYHCRTRLALSSPKVDINEAYRLIQQMREAKPKVWWKSTCYHYVRRTRQVTRYRNGDAYTSNQVYYERVNSRTSSNSFFYTSCGMKDVSKELVNLKKFPVTKIQFTKGFLFANVPTAEEFQEQRSRFFEEQERFDDYMEMREGLDLTNVNFKETMTVWTTPEHVPFYSKLNTFWFFSCILLSWPYRLIFELNTAHVQYQVIKLFGVNYMSANDRAQMQNQTFLRSTNYNRFRSCGYGSTLGYGYSPYRWRRRASTSVLAEINSSPSRDNVPSSPDHPLGGDGENQPLLLETDQDDSNDSEKELQCIFKENPTSSRDYFKSRTAYLFGFGCPSQKSGIPRSVTLLLSKPRRFSGLMDIDESDSEKFILDRENDEECFVGDFLVPSYSQALMMDPSDNYNTITDSYAYDNTNNVLLGAQTQMSSQNPHIENIAYPSTSTFTPYSTTNTNESDTPCCSSNIRPSFSRSTLSQSGDNPRVGNGWNFSSIRPSSSCSGNDTLPSTSGRRNSISSTNSISASSSVLNAVIPRSMTGVPIDLTQPVVVSVPRDPMATEGSVGPGNTKLESPPSYKEALKTSRPVFLPALARLRRCLTERDISGRFGNSSEGTSTNNHTTWLNNVNPIFLSRFTRESSSACHTDEWSCSGSNNAPTATNYDKISQV